VRLEPVRAHGDRGPRRGRGLDGERVVARAVRVDRRPAADPGAHRPGGRGRSKLRRRRPTPRRSNTPARFRWERPRPIGRRGSIRHGAGRRRPSGAGPGRPSR